jgi:hypothetical protein
LSGYRTVALEVASLRLLERGSLDFRQGQSGLRFLPCPHEGRGERPEKPSYENKILQFSNLLYEDYKA